MCPFLMSDRSVPVESGKHGGLATDIADTPMPTGTAAINTASATSGVYTSTLQLHNMPIYHFLYYYNVVTFV